MTKLNQKILEKIKNDPFILEKLPKKYHNDPIVIDICVKLFLPRFDNKLFRKMKTNVFFTKNTLFIEKFLDDYSKDTESQNMCIDKIIHKDLFSNRSFIFKILKKYDFEYIYFLFPHINVFKINKKLKEKKNLLKIIKENPYVLKYVPGFEFDDDILNECFKYFSEIDSEYYPFRLIKPLDIIFSKNRVFLFKFFNHSKFDPFVPYLLCNHIHNDLLLDKKFILKLLSNFDSNTLSNLYSKINVYLYRDLDFTNKILSIHPEAFEYMPEYIKNNKDVFFRVLGKIKTEVRWNGELQNNCIVKFVNKNIFLKKEKDIEYILKKDGCAIKFLNKKVRNNYDFVLLAVQNNGLSINYVSDHLKNNLIIVLNAIYSNSESIRFVGKKFKEDLKIINYVLSRNYIPFDYILNDLKIETNKLVFPINNLSFRITIDPKKMSDKYILANISFKIFLTEYLYEIYSQYPVSYNDRKKFIGQLFINMKIDEEKLLELEKHTKDISKILKSLKKIYYFFGKKFGTLFSGETFPNHYCDIHFFFIF